MLPMKVHSLSTKRNEKTQQETGAPPEPTVGQPQRIRDQLTALAAILFVALGLWGVYSHRVEVHLGQNPQLPGLAFNATSTPHDAAQSARATDAQAAVRLFQARLTILEPVAKRSNQEAALNLMSRRLSRLNGLLEQGLGDAAERVFVERRLHEFDQDLAVLEADLKDG